MEFSFFPLYLAVKIGQITILCSLFIGQLGETLNMVSIIICMYMLCSLVKGCVENMQYCLIYPSHFLTVEFITKFCVKDRTIWTRISIQNIHLYKKKTWHVLESFLTLPTKSRCRTTIVNAQLRCLCCVTSVYIVLQSKGVMTTRQARYLIKCHHNDIQGSLIL